MFLSIVIDINECKIHTKEINFISSEVYSTLISFIISGEMNSKSIEHAFCCMLPFPLI